MLYSWLFVPGNQKKHLQKVAELKADAFIFDLEDAVSFAEKERARDKVLETMLMMKRKDSYVRINEITSSDCLADLEKVVNPYLSGVMLPKVNQKEDIVVLDTLLHQLEIKKNISPGSTLIVPLIETTLGIKNVYEISQASERISRLAFGAEDLILELNLQPDGDEKELLFMRTQITLASKLAKLQAPIDSVYTDFTDDAGLQQAAVRGKRLGFGGKLLIHPNQISIVNNVFQPTAEEIVSLQRLVMTYEETIGHGPGVIQLDGKMVDLPIYERAKKLLTKYETYQNKRERE